MVSKQVPWENVPLYLSWCKKEDTNSLYKCNSTQQKKDDGHTTPLILLKSAPHQHPNGIILKSNSNTSQRWDWNMTGKSYFKIKSTTVCLKQHQEQHNCKKTTTRVSTAFNSLITANTVSNTKKQWNVVSMATQTIFFYALYWALLVPWQRQGL